MIPNSGRELPEARVWTTEFYTLDAAEQQRLIGEVASIPFRNKMVDDAGNPSELAALLVIGFQSVALRAHMVARENPHVKYPITPSAPEKGARIEHGLQDGQGLYELLNVAAADGKFAGFYRRVETEYDLETRSGFRDFDLDKRIMSGNFSHLDSIWQYGVEIYERAVLDGDQPVLHYPTGEFATRDNVYAFERTAIQTLHAITVLTDEGFDISLDSVDFNEMSGDSFAHINVGNGQPAVFEFGKVPFEQALDALRVAVRGLQDDRFSK